MSRSYCKNVAIPTPVFMTVFFPRQVRCVAVRGFNLVYTPEIMKSIPLHIVAKQNSPSKSERPIKTSPLCFIVLFGSCYSLLFFFVSKSPHGDRCPLWHPMQPPSSLHRGHGWKGTRRPRMIQTPNYPYFSRAPRFEGACFIPIPHFSPSKPNPLKSMNAIFWAPLFFLTATSNLPFVSFGAIPQSAGRDPDGTPSLPIQRPIHSHRMESHIFCLLKPPQRRAPLRIICN